MKSKYSYLLIPIISCMGLLVAVVLYVGNVRDAARQVMLVTMIAGTIPLFWRILQDIFRGHFGVDVIALAAIFTSFLLGEYLAGTVILIMLSGGEALEHYAKARAQKELVLLLSRAPTVAHKRRGSEIFDVPAMSIKPNDDIVVKPGEIIPVDGLVTAGLSMVDESAITGESLPVEKSASHLVSSGTVNQDGVLEIRAVKSAGQSRYQQIINLVRQAQESRAPIVRLADRYSVYFTSLTFIMAFIALVAFKDPERLLSVLVVASPCPLILATPIAIISGISWAAKKGIIVKNGGALERLGETESFVFDKTGTLTLGEPLIYDILAFGPSKAEILRLAASLDQLSGHILARSLVAYAKSQIGMEFVFPSDFRELPGQGVEGVIEGRVCHFGTLHFLKKHGVQIQPGMEEMHGHLQQQGIIAVYLAQDSICVGAICFSDRVRPDAKDLFAGLSEFKVQKVLMLTGDKKPVAKEIARKLGIDDFIAECMPEDKVLYVQRLQKVYKTVAMVGDGINDAPALATADVGIALGGHGLTASSEAGDIVITVNKIERVKEALQIARRAVYVAKEGILFGMGASLLLMVLASFGYIKPVSGALMQEALDVIVILNALRVNIKS